MLIISNVCTSRTIQKIEKTKKNIFESTVYEQVSALGRSDKNLRFSWKKKQFMHKIE